jgi:hypothetical protein
MTFATMTSAVRQRVATFIASLDASIRPTVVLYDNQKGEPDGARLWTRVSMISTESVLAAMGAKRRFRHPALLVLQLYDEPGRGTGTLDAIIDAAQTYFRGLTAAGIKYLVPSRLIVGRVEDWYQVNLQVPLYADDVET